MPIDTKRVRDYLRAYNLKDLFREELGWDNLKIAPTSIPVNGAMYTLSPIAEKRGFQVFVCSPDTEGNVPDSTTRAKIERILTQHAYQHLIVFADGQGTTQTWQWARHEANQPVAIRQETFIKGVKEERLIQKLDSLFVSIDEEEELTGIDVESKAKKAFDVEKVTENFYKRFKTEHGAFLKFISGIEGQDDLEWYVSLMLNRLMFIYFIQKKGFLDGDRDYLRNRLKLVQGRRGKGQFLSFYRQFLLRLFHEGLNKPDHSSDLQQLIGKVPYLNGGLFDVHQLEQDNPALDIPDEAFERIFDFFDDYDWHLDERPLRRDNEINPDVLGYIFERYINDQAKMGAYYTKEDITHYISQNTIIPFLFDAADKDCTIAFRADGALWSLLREQPNRYIYEAVRKGVDEPLPPTIVTGIKDVSKRDGWNRPADPGVALPTETWREHLARRQRCDEMRARLTAGDIRTINDLITYNLDIRQFAQDVIQNSEGPELLRAFYKAIERITVLDPTCGSGAFLFAALNILEPLYDACLERMQAFVDDLDRSHQPHSPQKFEDFRTILGRVKDHPNRRYFILKSIILNNLYGVDIMEEAVEICKLRLFLKLAAQVEPDSSTPNYGMEPLPDIDFNIRTGNTLVGFATYDDVKRALTTKMDFDNVMPEIEESAEIVARAFQQFRNIQTKSGMLATDFAQAKGELRHQLKELDEKLNRYLALEYGIYAAKTADFEQWKQTHQPFHWFVEFYGITNRGGFDVIIGNPPYVEYSKVKSMYSIQFYQTISCGNLYAFVFERSLTLAARRGRCGLIVPLSVVCTQRMSSLRNLISQRGSWISNYDMRPGSLFEGIAQRLSIVLCINEPGSSAPVFTGGYRRWSSQERQFLIQTTIFTIAPQDMTITTSIPKFSSQLEHNILAKIGGKSLGTFCDPSAEPIYIHRIVRYFIKALTFIPTFIDTSGKHGKSDDYKAFRFALVHRIEITALLNSTLFYWFWRSHSDGFHCGYGDVYMMPFKEEMTSETKEKLIELQERLMLSLRDTSVEKSISPKTGTIRYQEFYPKLSKPIIDEIDRVLARHYELRDEELDFIINYDIKYRMGRDNQKEDEE